MKVIPLYKNQDRLIARALQNNRQAQHELYQLFSPKMLSVCRMYVKDLQEAEEVMLNGFFKVFTHLKNFKSEGSFEGWIRKIMVRECLSFIRQKKQIVFEEVTAATETVQNEVFSGLEVARIQQLIDQLPEGYKLVFVMYAIEGYKHHEIAELLHIDTGTSKSQLHKARKLLQEKLSPQNNADYGSTKL
jgi:RNA polymerase sigma factor (sigma-70 family)